eukprot:1555593-Amphidinium_carterae.1
MAIVFTIMCVGLLLDGVRAGFSFFSVASKATLSLQYQQLVSCDNVWLLPVLLLIVVRLCTCLSLIIFGHFAGGSSRAQPVR